MKLLKLSIFLAAHFSFAALTPGEASRISAATLKATTGVSTAVALTDRFGEKIVSARLKLDTICVIALSITRGAFLLGAEGGEGAMSCRLPQGGWSAPSYIRTGGFELSAAIGFDVMNISMFITDPALAQRMKGQLNFDARAYASAVAGTASAALTASGRYGMAVVQSNRAGLFAGVGISFSSMSHMQAQRNQIVYQEIFGGATPVDRFGRPCSSYLLPVRREACIAEFSRVSGASVNKVTVPAILSLPYWQAPQLTQSFPSALSNLMP